MALDQETSITSLIAFTPAAFWDFLAQWTRRSTALAVRIYYDEPCGFCKKISLILRSLLVLPEAPVEPAQSTPKVRAILEKNNSWVFRSLALDE